MLKKLAHSLIFLGAIVLITTIALRLGAYIANPTTVGFSLIMLVAIAALSSGRVVGIATSIIATLFFNFFFFPPVGTFTIADRHNWIALFAFLFTAILVSRLTASALENARKAHDLVLTMNRLKQFGDWLLSTPHAMLTLSGIADVVTRIFQLKYCSIHVYAEGKWHHFSGTSSRGLSEQIAESLRIPGDHQTRILELAEEEALGVRYTQIGAGKQVIGLLVLRDSYLTQESISAIAGMIGIILVEVFKDTRDSTVVTA